MQNPLKLGFFIQPVHPPSRPYADVLREDREAVVLADRLGYREAFIGEHLVDAAETITSSLAFIASLADACPSITFGTGVLPLANYHPAMAAAQVAMVDHLVQGRLVLGVGPGVPGDAEAIGDLGSDRNRKSAGGARSHVPDLERSAAVPDRRRVLPDHDGALARSGHRGGRRTPSAATAASADRHHLDPAGRRGTARGGRPRLDRNLGDLRGSVRRAGPHPELPGRPALGGTLRRSLRVARGAQRLRRR